MAKRRTLLDPDSSGSPLRWLRGRAGVGPAPALSHGRVYLRPPRGSDWQEWAALRDASRAFLAPWEPTWSKDALTRSAFRRRLDQYADEWSGGTGYHFLVFRTDDAAMLGGINVINVRRGIVQAGTLGYWIGAPFARRGYMTEAMRAMLSFAFEHLELHRLEAACLPHNRASEALLLKAGFRGEGLARKYLRIDGTWQDHATFALLREDWEAGEGDGAGGRRA